MPGVGMFIVILVGMLLTGAVAFYVAHNVEHGEARFGPDGQLAPYEPREEEEKDWGVTVKRSEEGGIKKGVKGTLCDQPLTKVSVTSNRRQKF